ncbi:MAG: hypothetical protein ABI867_06180 [Kofleriaceae bacterium]
MTSTSLFRFALGLAVLCGACGGGGGSGDDDDDAPVDARPPIDDCGNGTCDLDETTASCPADCQPVCGDGVCEVGETISSCAEDCASATCTVGDPNSCTGETICINNTCENAFGRNYKIKIASAVFTEKKANGDAWDIAGGLPDGKATITINNVATTTPVIGDTLMPVWNFVTPPTLIPGGTILKIEVVDDDVAADDAGWACQNNPLTAELLRAGARCSGVGALANAHVDFSFTPN